MEVRIGVTHANRELIVESNQSPEDVETMVRDALAAGSGMLSLSDDKGRTVHVPVDKLAYVEVTADSVRRMGFGVS